MGFAALNPSYEAFAPQADAPTLTPYIPAQIKCATRKFRSVISGNAVITRPLLERAHAGEEIILAKAGKAYARLLPIREPSSERRLGRPAGHVGEAFFEPLPEEELRSWEGSNEVVAGYPRPALVVYR